MSQQDSAMNCFARLAVVGLGLVLLAAAGCGGDAVPGTLKTFPATGTITLDGKAFGPARLVFTPASSDAPQPTGLADASGKITLTTYVTGDGMPAGTYKVSISPDPMMTPAPAHPDLYNNSSTTSLSVTVAEKGPNEFKLDMDSNAGPSSGSPAGAIPPGATLPEGIDPAKAYGPVVVPGASPPPK
jgi:hypothetical protein